MERTANEIRQLSKLSAEEIDRLRMLRWQARTDLGFLCRDILNYPDVSDIVHKPVLDILQKFPLPNRDQFYENDKLVGGTWVYKPLTKITSLPGARRVLILDPRGWLKTTINAQAHTIQWILNYPDIAIMIFQSNLEKAEMILGEIKKHFKYNPTFRMLFPEHCPMKSIEEFGTKAKFTSMARGHAITRKEETVMASSIDAGSAGIHVDVMKFSDIVEPSNVGTKEQMESVTKSFYMAHNLLVGPNFWIDVEGTRYNFCLEGNTGIMMSDWNQKPISDIKIGDEVVGWVLENGKRWLRKSKVTATGSYIRETNKYLFESGKEIICTPDHHWWRGKGWSKGPFSNEYGTLGNGYKNKNMQSLRRLCVPAEKDLSYDAGWLSGMFDGEGSFRKNPNHPSGAIQITQTMHNPSVVQQLRDTLTALNFKFSESFWTYKDKPKYEAVAHHEDRYNFIINGGWKERYRFLKQISPVKKEKISQSLFGQLMTEEDKLVSVEPAGEKQVYWFECETGNYIAEGYCSKNSDTYGRIIDSERRAKEEDKVWKIHARGCYKKKLDDPKFTPAELDLPDMVNEKGEFVLHWDSPEKGFTFKNYEAVRRSDSYLFSSQQLNSPQGGIDGRQIFPIEKNKYPVMISRKNFTEHVRVSHYIATVDTAETANQRSNYSCITIAAFASDGKVYVNEIIHGKFMPDELTEIICNLITPCDVAKKRRPFFYGERLKSINIEETGFTRGLMVGLKSYQHLKGIYLPLKMIKKDNQVAKIERIQNSLQPFYTSGRLIFLDDIGPWDHLLDELRQFPTSQNDDILDTLADLFQEKEWFGRETPKLNPMQFKSQALAKLLGTENPFDPDFSYGDESTPMHPTYQKTGGL